MVDTALLVGEGNASVSLSALKVSDEGTYICTVSTGLFQAQQVIQLEVIRESSPFCGRLVYHIGIYHIQLVFIFLCE